MKIRQVSLFATPNQGERALEEDIKRDEFLPLRSRGGARGKDLDTGRVGC